MTEENRTKGHEYVNQSRGFKTKGNSYKDRYVERTCPDCKHNRAYKDTWKTRIAYTCLKRSCRHKWYEVIERPVIDSDGIAEIDIAIVTTESEEVAE